MTPKLPGIAHRKAVKAFEKAGFRVKRESKHIIMTDGERVITHSTSRPSGLVHDGNDHQICRLDHRTISEAALRQQNSSVPESNYVVNLHAVTTAAHALNDPLAKISSELDECSLRVERLVEQASERLWTAPARGGWAIGQCVAHLTRTAEVWVPGLEEALQEAQAGSPPYTPTLTGRLLRWFLEPPYRMKFKAQPNFTPRDRKLTPPELLGAFLATQQEVQRALRLANGKAIDRTIIPSPVDARLKYDVYSAFRILAAHERRHLWQAERVLEALAAGQ